MEEIDVPDERAPTTDSTAVRTAPRRAMHAWFAFSRPRSPGAVRTVGAGACAVGLAACVVFSGRPTLTIPPPEISEHRSTYPVFGTTLAELRRTLSESTVPVDGVDAAARTQFELGAIGRCEPFSGGYALAQVKVSVRIDIELPEWQPVSQPTADLAARWKRAVAALERHEDGHRAIVLEAAEALRRDLLDIPPADSCEAVNAALGDVLRRVNDRQMERQRAYDAETAHGINQGAVL